MKSTKGKEFHAYNSTAKWLADNSKTARTESHLNAIIECSGTARALRDKILEAEILRDLSLIQASNRIGFPVKSYAELRLILEAKPFWNNASVSHKCTGAPCVRCKVCNAFSNEMSIDEFIAARSVPRPDVGMMNVSEARNQFHRCGLLDRAEVEFSDNCQLRRLEKDRVYESLREPGVTIRASSWWFICTESGKLHYCPNEGDCSKMSLKIHEGSPVSYSCALTGLHKRSLLESWTPWDGVNFYSAAKIHSIQNRLTSERISVTEDGGDDHFDTGGMDLEIEEPAGDNLPDEAPADEVHAPVSEEQELRDFEKRKLSRASDLEVESVTPKRRKVSFVTSADEATELIGVDETHGSIVGGESLLGIEEEDEEEEEEEEEGQADAIQQEHAGEEGLIVKELKLKTINDFGCYEVPLFDVAMLVETFSNMATASLEIELTNSEEAKAYNSDALESRQKLKYSSQKFASISRDTYAIFKRLRRAIRAEMNGQKLQLQNSSIKRNTISASGVSQPLVDHSGQLNTESCFEVNARDFFSANYQMTKEEKIAVFLERGTLESALAFVREIISPGLKTKISLLAAEKSVKSSNVFVAELLNRYEMPLMSAVGFWMDNMSKLINGPIHFLPVEIDELYYAQVIVAHWREFVMADYMEELLTERKKKKTKQMDFSLFAVGVLYSMAAGGVLVRPSCQDERAIPELFVGTTVYRLLVNGQNVRELPDGSAELKDSLLAPHYLAYISEIYSRGYRFDEKTYADACKVFRLCYTYRHRNARIKLFARAREAVYTSLEEKDSIARDLYNQYLENLKPPHSKAGCKRTTKA